MRKFYTLLALSAWVAFILCLALFIPKITNDFALTLCWGKYDTPACHERLEAEKDFVYQRDKVKQ